MPDWFPYPIRYVGDCGISRRGYSMRGNLAALREVGVTEKQIDVMPWPPTMSLQEDWFFDAFLRSRTRPVFTGNKRLNLIDVCFADVAHLWTAGWYNVVVADWALDRPPADVKVVNDHCQEVWATSDHVKARLLQGGVEIPIYVIPWALQPELLEKPPKAIAPDIAPEVHPYIGPHEFKHTSAVYFYYIGCQNVEGLVRAFFSTGWRAKDPVELIIHNHRGGVLLDELRDHVKDPPIVRLLQTPKSYGWIAKLHQMNHVFVTATQAGGFCLPAWEAAAAGNLVVVPQDAVEPPPGARLFTTSRSQQGDWLPDLGDLANQMHVAFDLVRAGATYEQTATEARLQASPAAVGKLLKERLVAIRAELED
jgi:hypothetical protein